MCITCWCHAYPRATANAHLEYSPIKKGTPTYQPTYHTTYTYLHLPLAVVQLHLRLPTPIPRGAAADLAGRTETNNEHRTSPSARKQRNHKKRNTPTGGLWGESYGGSSACIVLGICPHSMAYYIVRRGFQPNNAPNRFVGLTVWHECCIELGGLRAESIPRHRKPIA